MNFAAIRALVAKDFTLFFRNRFFALMTPLALLVYIGLYFVMPGSVDETIDIGVYAPGLPAPAEEIQQVGLEVHAVDSEDELMEGVVGHRYAYGILLPADLAERLAAGEKPRIDLYLASDAPEE